jgi:hypothetical protein
MGHRKAPASAAIATAAAADKTIWMSRKGLVRSRKKPFDASTKQRRMETAAIDGIIP